MIETIEKDKKDFNARCKRLCGSKIKCFAPTDHAKRLIDVIEKIRPSIDYLSHIAEYGQCKKYVWLLELATHTLDELVRFSQHLSGMPLHNEVTDIVREHRVCMSDMIINHAWPVMEFIDDLSKDEQCPHVVEVLTILNKRLELLISLSKKTNKFGEEKIKCESIF